MVPVTDENICIIAKRALRVGAVGSWWVAGVAMLPVRCELTRFPEKFRVRLERRLIIK